jgi:HlyD family secretion protein
MHRRPTTLRVIVALTAPSGVRDVRIMAMSATARKRIAAALALVLAGGGYLAYRFHEQGRPYQWSGTVEARNITVGSRTGGRVKEVLVQEGDRVPTGKPLLVLEAGDLDAQKAQAEGELAEAMANQTKVEAGSRPEEIAEANARASEAAAALSEAQKGARVEDIAQAQARFEAEQAAVDKAEADSRRAKKLVSTGAISQAEADDTEIARRTAIAQRDALKQALDALVHGTRVEDVAQASARASQARAAASLLKAGSRVEDVQAARAQVTAAKGKLDRIESDISELTIKAPRASRVESLDLRPGDILGPNAPAATLLEDDQLYVRIYVPETRIALIHIGQEVPVTVDSFPDRSFRGVVEHIAEVGEYTPRNLETFEDRADEFFATRVGLREGQDTLRAGMAAFVRVPK